MGNSNKILTDSLLEELLAQDRVTLPEETSHDVQLDKIQGHFDFTETTADGYEVWIATDDDQRPSVNDDIYYYESDWLEKMEDAMTDGLSIYFQELDDDNYEFKEIVYNVYEEYYNDKKQELEDKLIDDGYERESTEATTEMV